MRATSPQASMWTETDWHRLEMLAPLVEAYYAPETDAKTRISLMAELRLNEAKLGITPEDRARLHWRIDPISEADVDPDDPYAHLRAEWDGVTGPRRSRDRPDPRLKPNP